MQLLDGELVLSASDLTGFAACGHLTQLELSVVNGERERPDRDDPMLDVLSRRGGEHEDKQLARYHEQSRSVAEIPADCFTRAELADAEAQTVAASAVVGWVMGLSMGIAAFGTAFTGAVPLSILFALGSWWAFNRVAGSWRNRREIR
jgi:hypothetical protein